MMQGTMNVKCIFLFNRTSRAPVRYLTKTWSVVLLNKKKNTYTPISSVLCMTSS